MKQKWSLYAGILILTTGILLKIFTDMDPVSTLIIVGGVLFKVYYIIINIVKGIYKPGYELVFLLVGLTMFISGRYLLSPDGFANPAFLTIPGIMLKIAFVALFIRKSRMSSVSNDSA